MYAVGLLLTTVDYIAFHSFLSKAISPRARPALGYDRKKRGTNPDKIARSDQPICSGTCPKAAKERKKTLTGKSLLEVEEVEV